MVTRPIKVIDFDNSFEDLGDGNNWGIYKVIMKMSDGEEQMGFCQGDGDFGNWALETFEKYNEED